MGQTFRGFRGPRPLGAGVAACPNMGAQNIQLTELLKTMIVGALWIDLGLLSIRVLCFRNRMKNNGVMGLNAVREIACGA